MSLETLLLTSIGSSGIARDVFDSARRVAACIATPTAKRVPKTHLHLQGAQINSTSSASSILSPEAASGPSLEPSLTQDSLGNQPTNSRNKEIHKVGIEIIELSQTPPAVKLASDDLTSLYLPYFEMSEKSSASPGVAWLHFGKALGKCSSSLRFTSSYFVLQSFPGILGYSGIILVNSVICINKHIYIYISIWIICIYVYYI